MSKRVRGTPRPSGARPAARPARRDVAVPVRAPDPTGPSVVPAGPTGEPPTTDRPLEPRAAAVTPRGGPARASARAARAATEYVDVGQDLRHIGTVFRPNLGARAWTSVANPTP